MYTEENLGLSFGQNLQKFKKQIKNKYVYGIKISFRTESQ